ncbi:hypothetical protein [Pseudomaricurvus hydrocarbonicus]|nr:hypothetical protein [Aestuariicella hydrocarbonica]
MSKRVYAVNDHGWLRLPSNHRDLTLESLAVGTAAKLFVPADIRSLRVNHLTLSHKAIVSIAPRYEEFVLTVQRADFADGSMIVATGENGDLGVPGGHGTDLRLTLASGRIANLTLDTRGGDGGRGWPGEAGQNGRDATCWGRGTSRGQSGGQGGDGQPGGDGGNITLKLADPQWLEVIDVRQYGGQGGLAGEAGAAGKGGDPASCWLYSLGRDARGGHAGSPGKASSAGRQGILRVQ